MANTKTEHKSAGFAVGSARAEIKYGGMYATVDFVPTASQNVARIDRSVLCASGDCLASLNERTLVVIGECLCGIQNNVLRVE